MFNGHVLFLSNNYVFLEKLRKLKLQTLQRLYWYNLSLRIFIFSPLPDQVRQGLVFFIFVFWPRIAARYDGSVLSLLIDYWSFGISRRTYGFALVRPGVRACVRACVTRYLEIRTSDFSETWHKVASWRD